MEKLADVKVDGNKLVALKADDVLPLFKQLGVELGTRYLTDGRDQRISCILGQISSSLKNANSFDLQSLWADAAATVNDAVSLSPECARVAKRILESDANKAQNPLYLAVLVNELKEFNKGVLDELSKLGPLELSLAGNSARAFINSSANQKQCLAEIYHVLNEAKIAEEQKQVDKLDAKIAKELAEIQAKISGPDPEYEAKVAEMIAGIEQLGIGLAQKTEQKDGIIRTIQSEIGARKQHLAGISKQLEDGKAETRLFQLQDSDIVGQLVQELGNAREKVHELGKMLAQEIESLAKELAGMQEPAAKSCSEIPKLQEEINGLQGKLAEKQAQLADVHNQEDKRIKKLVEERDMLRHPGSPIDDAVCDAGCILKLGTGAIWSNDRTDSRYGDRHGIPGHIIRIMSDVSEDNYAEKRAEVYPSLGIVHSLSKFLPELEQNNAELNELFKEYCAKEGTGHTPFGDMLKDVAANANQKEILEEMRLVLYQRCRYKQKPPTYVPKYEGHRYYTDPYSYPAELPFMNKDPVGAVACAADENSAFCAGAREVLAEVERLTGAEFDYVRKVIDKSDLRDRRVE